MRRGASVSRYPYSENNKSPRKIGFINRYCGRHRSSILNALQINSKFTRFRLPTTLLTNNVHVSTNLLKDSLPHCKFRSGIRHTLEPRVRIPLYILDWESELESDIRVMLSSFGDLPRQLAPLAHVGLFSHWGSDDFW